jgi:hypothetical protein
MCEFFSALVTKTGEVLWHEMTDRHELLIAHFGLPDTAEPNVGMRPFIRVEFTPALINDIPDYATPENYQLKIDERNSPIWFTDEMREVIILKLQDIIRKMIVSNHREILLGGSWILINGARVNVAQGCKINAVCAGGSVNEVWGSVNEVWGSVNEVWGSVNEVCAGGKIINDWRNK